MLASSCASIVSSKHSLRLPARLQQIALVEVDCERAGSGYIAVADGVYRQENSRWARGIPPQWVLERRV